MSNENPRLKDRGFFETISVSWQGILGLAGAFVAGLMTVIFLGDVRGQPEAIEENRRAIEQETELRREADMEITNTLRALIYNQRQIINNQTRQLCRLEGKTAEECDRIQPLPIPSPQLPINSFNR